MPDPRVSKCATPTLTMPAKPRTLTAIVSLSGSHASAAFSKPVAALTTGLPEMLPKQIRLPVTDVERSFRGVEFPPALFLHVASLLAMICPLKRSCRAVCCLPASSQLI